MPARPSLHRLPCFETLEERCLLSTTPTAVPSTPSPASSSPSVPISSVGQQAGHSLVVNATQAVSPTAQASTAKVDLGQAVVSFARANLGRKVGDGQCATLAIQALQYAGAKTTLDYGVSGPTANYVWGSLVLMHQAGTAANWTQVKPGDVIQYSNVVITTKTVYPRGGWSVQTQTMQHHTAIVSANLGGGRFTVLEQNVNGRLVVQQDQVNLANMTRGTIWIYRPVKK